MQSKNKEKKKKKKREKKKEKEKNGGRKKKEKEKNEVLEEWKATAKWLGKGVARRHREMAEGVWGNGW